MQNNKIYNALILGLGKMGALNDALGSGNEHKTISFANALTKHPHFHVDCYDVDNHKMSDAIDIWDMCYYDATKQYDLVVIATPDDRHYEELLFAIQLRPKLVICEKPMCQYYHNAKEIVELYEKNNIPILVDYTRRFIPYWQGVKQDIEEDKYGALLDYSVNYNRGKLHTGTHITDLFNYLLPNFVIDYDKLNYIDGADYRIFDLKLFFEKTLITEHRINNMRVSMMYDHHTRHVIYNAYGYLEGKEKLMCDMYDGLKALELMKI